MISLEVWLNHILGNSVYPLKSYQKWYETACYTNALPCQT